MKSLYSLFLLMEASAFMACTDTSIINEFTNQEEFSVEAILEPLISDNADNTRVAPTDIGDGHYSFNWQANDKIAIYGQTSNSSGWSFFQLSGNGGDAAGVFSGIFKMTNETTYYSFYPPRYFTSETSPSTIMLDYTGQMQMADGDMTHLRNYIYYAAAQEDDGRFKFKHVGALLKITLPDEQSDDCTGATFITTGEGKFITKGQIDLTSTTTNQAPSITPIETTSSFTIRYSHGMSTNSGKITIYAMIAPTDLSNNSLTITTNHSNVNFNKTYAINPQLFLAGKPYDLIGNELIEDGDILNGHEYVDLGLPNGTLWATCNIGASKPEEYGDYFAWGEIEAKNEYNVNNYALRHIKKDTDSDGFEIEEEIWDLDDGNICGTEYDVAHEKWGGSWQIPTTDDFEMLIQNCTWKWGLTNGIYGYKITGNNGNSIFLPAGGYKSNDYDEFVSQEGDYWTSNATGKKHAYYLWISSTLIQCSSGSQKQEGRTIRPICRIIQ